MIHSTQPIRAARIQKAFERIGLAKVSTSAEEARALGFLRRSDPVTVNPDRLVFDAKKRARALADAGYTPPAQRTAKIPGSSGRAAIERARQDGRKTLMDRDFEFPGGA